MWYSILQSAKEQGTFPRCGEISCREGLQEDIKKGKENGGCADSEEAEESRRNHEGRAHSCSDAGHRKLPSSQKPKDTLEHCSCCNKCQALLTKLQKENSTFKEEMSKREFKELTLQKCLLTYKNVCDRFQDSLARVSNGIPSIPDTSEASDELVKSQNDVLSYKKLAQMYAEDCSESAKDAEKYKCQLKDLSRKLDDANMIIKEQQKQLMQLSRAGTCERRLDLPLRETAEYRRARSLPSSPHRETSFIAPKLNMSFAYPPHSNSATVVPPHRYFEPEELLSMSDVIPRCQPYGQRIVLHPVVNRSLSDSKK